MSKARVSKATLTTVEYPAPNQAVIITFTGCPYACESCDGYVCKGDNGSVEMDAIEIFITVANKAERNRTNLIVLAGEPLSDANIETTRRLLAILNPYGFLTAIYTDFEIKDVISKDVNGFEFVKCGAYDPDKAVQPSKDEFQMVLPSSNQDFYNNQYKRISNNGILTFKERL